MGSESGGKDRRTLDETPVEGVNMTMISDVCLRSWLHEKRLEPQPMELRRVGIEGRGLVATKRIRRGEALLQVPKSALVDATKATRASRVAEQVYRQEGDEWSVLAAFLAESRARSKARLPCEHAPYIDALPKSTGCIFEWTDKEVKELLRGSSVQEDAKHLRNRLREAVELVLDASRNCEGGEIDLDEEGVVWAYSQLLSRLIRLESDSSSLVLVPWADMLNHSPSCSAHIDWDVASERVVLRTDRQYEEGEQVYTSYGERSSGELLLSYGFVPALGTNPFDTAKIILGIDPRDPALQEKESLMEDFGWNREEYFPLRINGIPESLLQYARVVAAEVKGGEQTMELARRVMLSGGDAATSIEVEVKARRLIVQACQKALQGYGRTMDEDRRTMKAFGDVEEQSTTAETPPGRISAAAALRVRERQILNRTEFALRDQVRLLKAEGVPKPRVGFMKGFLGRLFE